MSENNQDNKKSLVITGNTVLKAIGVLAIVVGIVNILLVILGYLEFEVYLLLITFVPGILCLILGFKNKH